MNERIKEIAEQAGFPDWWIKPIEPERQNGESEKMIEKFAELIVKECIGCCEQVISDQVPEYFDTWLSGGSQCIKEIEEHFGVYK